MDAPAKWPGTPTSAIANRNSHRWDNFTNRCFVCDANIIGRTAEWPCGADIPRVELSRDEWDAYMGEVFK